MRVIKSLKTIKNLNKISKQKPLNKTIKHKTPKPKQLKIKEMKKATEK